MNFFKRAIFLFVIGASTAQAFVCDSEFAGKQFWGVSIKNGVTTCSYRYCYYGCIYDSYTLPGCYAPGNGPWEQFLNKKGNAHCSYSSGSCEFYGASCNKL